MQESPLIGLCDGPIEKKETNYYTNKIGGSPDFFPGVSNPYYRCCVCDGILSHIVQIYCPLASSPYHRTVNVFACTAQECYGKQESWKVLRSQCLESAIKQLSECQASNRTQISTTDWCDEADDWGMEAEDNKDNEQTHTTTAQSGTDNLAADLDVSSRLEGLYINKSAGSEAAGPLPTMVTFQPFYISVVEETDLADHTDLDHANRLLKEYEDRERVSVRAIDSCEAEGVPEKYEKTEAKHGDAVFSHFRKRISLCPEQILRIPDSIPDFSCFHMDLTQPCAEPGYCWSGTPLFILEPPLNINQMVPPCAHCGSPRVFEFQLMPALVSLLRSGESSSELSLEFGTILVYTCRDSCWISGSTVPVVEFLFMQADPDYQLFK